MSSVWNNTIAKEREDAAKNAEDNGVLKWKLETAERLFFKMNMPLQFICDVTKLPLDQVHKHLSAQKDISVDENKN